MLTCKETARLVSERLDRKLTAWQRINLRMHLMMCGACSAYRRQIETLNRVIRERFADPSQPPGNQDPPGKPATPACPDTTKQRITRALRERLG